MGLRMEAIIKTVRNVLRDSIDEKTKASSQNFFKEKIKFLGVKVPTVKRISEEYYQLIKSKTKPEIFDLCEALWSSMKK